MEFTSNGAEVRNCLHTNEPTITSSATTAAATENVFAKVKRDNINIEGTGASGDSQLKKVEFKKNVTVVVQDPESETKVPTIITSDGPLEVDYKRNIAHFTKNVVAQHEQGTLKADCSASPLFPASTNM